ncbi:MAG TPA: hypothetical protein VGP72_20905 [Planctomycetota bacterium]|jgi:hypothetical protein
MTTEPAQAGERTYSAMQTTSALDKILDRRSAMFGLLLVATALLLHACWNAPLYYFDDTDIMKNSLGVPWSARLGLRPDIAHYPPVTTLSRALDLLLFGDARNDPPAQPRDPVLRPPLVPRDYAVPPPWSMRLMNGLYHLLAGYFLWLFLRRIGAGTGLAAFVALAWTAHPMACESVCWIAERKNVLVALFGFAALWAWAAGRGETAEPIRDPQSAIRNSHWWRWPLVTLFYALAVMSKTSAVGLLPVLAALELIDPPLHRFNLRQPVCWFRFVVRMALPAALCFAAMSFAMVGFETELVSPPGGSAWTAFLTDTDIFWRYMKNVFAPFDLSFFYGVVPALSLADARVWIYGTLIIAVFAVSIWSAPRDRRPLAILGTLWFFSALLPNANIVAIAYWMQDRYVYLAAPGLLLVVGLAVQGLVERRPKLTPFLRPAAGLWLAGIALLGAQRSHLFEHTDYLILDALRRQPDSAFARLAATRVFEHRFRYYATDGTRPDPELQQQAAEDWFSLYEGLENCPDVRSHIDPFTIRVRKAGLLPALGRLRDARAVIGRLPPDDVPMLSFVDDRGQSIQPTRGQRGFGYLPLTLATAYRILAESDLERAAAKDLAIEKRFAAAKQAAAEADAAQKLSRDSALIVLNARALIRVAELYTEQKDAESARKTYDEAARVLGTVPAKSPWSPIAKNMQSTIPQK